MNMDQVFHMVGGAGENSYANNSRLQEKAIFKTKPFVEEAIKEILKTLPEKFVVADLGCSSGPNTFRMLSEVINVVDQHCHQLSQQKPEIQFFLNDLPSNDFNNLFQLSMLYEQNIREEKGDDYVPFYVVGLPGSFYGRLFPSKSVHFFHSSYCLMWLSQVPKGLEGEKGYQLNGTDIYISKESSSIVSHLYLEQFKRDFLEFLKSRSKELIFGGRMILSFLGRTNCPSSEIDLYFWGDLADALKALVSEGLVEEDKLNAFNLPFYAPLMEEVKSTINMEGSFHLDQLQTFESNEDPFDESNDNFVVDKSLSAKNIAKYTRAILEPLLVSHFGNDIMEDLFSLYAKNIEKLMSAGKPKAIEVRMRSEGP
ncbi:anthranilate O-methyltransferase 1-like isoform X2 [Dendrobium catenatum]|uniref:anthranilate O-methyltransferase 1-like isoform X2 n=1 Tax=Dendrobium catenatum TaxID=906689 RepID=UPI00109F6ADB|nr:anthranilate O-methyltransferase 1-like isoform X2 [Dendrobium catenatum]